MKDMNTQGAVRMVGLEKVAEVTGQPTTRAQSQPGRTEWIAQTECIIDCMTATLTAHYYTTAEEEQAIETMGMQAVDWKVSCYTIG